MDSEKYKQWEDIIERLDADDLVNLKEIFEIKEEELTKLNGQTANTAVESDN